MRYFCLLIITLFFLFGFNSQNFSQANNFPSTNQFEGLEFDKNIAFLACPIALPSPLNEEPIVKVTVKTLKQPQNIKYRYSVSGGRIDGRGANVNWDLSKTPHGRYKITVKVFSESFQRNFTREILLAPSPACDFPCLCPNLNIISPSQKVKLGKIAVFAVKVDGGSQTALTYNWTISEGKIIKGQGTPKIKVATKDLSTKTITATVEISGDFCAECYRTASSAAEIY